MRRIQLTSATSRVLILLLQHDLYDVYIFRRSRLVINPEGSFLKVWLALITVIVLYYAWILIARQAFEQLRTYVSLILSSFIADE